MEKDVYTQRIYTAGSDKPCSETENKIIDYWYKNKSINRIERIIKTMRSFYAGKKIPITDIGVMYKSDIIIRRVFSRFLKPIEIKLRADLLYFWEANNIKTLEDLKGIVSNKTDIATTYKRNGIKLNKPSKKNIEKSVNGAHWMIFNATKYRDEKKGRGEKYYKHSNNMKVDNLIEYSSFGELTSMIIAMNYGFHSKFYNDHGFAVIALKRFVELRNVVAHHSIVLKNNLFVRPGENDLPKIIYQMGLFLKRDISKEIDDAIDIDNWENQDLVNLVKEHYIQK